MTISKDIPLSEITLRRYEKPYEMPRRELIRKLCLSLGLLQPGDSRDVIVDVLQVLLDYKQKNKMLDSEEVKREVIALRKKNKLLLKGIASSNIRRQLKRLKDLSLAENINNEYRITEFQELEEVFNERIEKFMLPNIISRVKEYLKTVK
ncbi:hypothetical protein FJZ53_04330 [Candidatus Woesearchaeota archaeon]|nr:hypothetical protein [Candidatus Woesearchaeota archaeon]